MTQYCMEVSVERGEALVHTVSCGSFDLGSLLATGNVFGLGDFARSESALKEARKRHDNAIRCVDCCVEDLIPRCINDQIARNANGQAEEDLKHNGNNNAAPIRSEGQQTAPGFYAPTTTRIAEFTKDKQRQFPTGFFA